jgi:hypothetical protein
MPPVGTATKQLQPVFNQAQQTLQGQVPAIQNLYQALIQGLQAQGAAQTQNVVQSAEMRGVGRAGLEGDVQAQLGQELALQGGQLGFQQAQDVAGARQRVGQLNTERVGRVNDLAQSLQDTRLGEKTAKIERKKADRAYELDLQKAERTFELSKIAFARAQAEKAARASSRQKDESLATSQALLAVDSLWKPGADGYVNPKQWNEIRQAFMEAGYSGGSFDSEFGALINPAHQRRGSKLPKYKGASIRDED